MGIEFRILGPLELSVDGRVLPLGSPKQRALLGLLLVHANETLSRDRLIEGLWGEVAPATVESAFHSYLSRLRRLLESAGAGGVLVRDGYGYRLGVGPTELDVNRFAGLAGEGREALAAGKVELAADRFHQALALWRGPPLADLQSERFAITAAARLEEERVSALEQRLEADLALARHRELVAELETLVAEHPYRERLRAQLMLALYRSGRQAEALSAYQEVRRTLADELGLEPGQQLKELEQAILRQDPALESEASVKSHAEREPEPSPPPRSSVPMPREERKVVTVLFADLVGFTAQAELLDPEDVRAFQDRYWMRLRAEIERYGGTVEKFVGDAVMALFGAPQAHEDDPERAVRAALAIRDWAREQEQLEVRSAVVTGEALVRLAADPLAGEGMASGDVVNTAARLEGAATANGILVGERTYRATEHVIEYRKTEPVQARGKSEPIPVWQALRARSRLGGDFVHQRGAPLVGRERELELVFSTLARVRAERAPQLVTLVGVPGIGKSRLAYELMQAVARDPSVIITWRQGRSLPYGDGVSFWALAEIVKGQAGILESDTDEQAGEKLVRAVETVVEDEREAKWIERHLRPLAGLVIDGVAAEGSEVEAFAAWRRFFEALADWRPLVLVFEDLHWADDGLLDFVDGLLEWVSDVPLIVLATARPELLERRPGWAGGKPNASTLSLSPLSEEETERLLVALLGGSPLAIETRSKLLASAGGNPLYAEQYVRVQEEREEATELPMPETVQAVIAARLDALPPAEKSLLQDAAVFGNVFWDGAAAALEGIDRSTLEPHLHTLERKEFVRHMRRSSVANESEYAFRHVLLRDVAYGGIPHKVRSDKHLRAAEWIESLGRREDHAELLAHHYVSALEHAHGDDETKATLARRAHLALRDAGDRAFSLNANAQAARLYGDALALWPAEDDARPRLLFRYGSALHATGAVEQQPVLEDAREALLAAGDVDTAAEAEALLADMWWYRAEGDRARRHRERAVGLVQDRPPSPPKARVLAAVSLFRLSMEEYEEAIRVGGEALAVANALGLGELRAELLVTVGTAASHLGHSAGETELERGLEIALDEGALRVAARAYNHLGWVMSAKGDYTRRLELGAAALRLAERLGDAQQVRLLQAYMCCDLSDGGEWDEALTIADEFIAECESGSPHIQEPLMRMTRASIRLARGEEDKALADWERGMAIARGAQSPLGVMILLLAGGAFLHAELGRLAEARALADELLSLADDVVGDEALGLAFVAGRIGRRTELLAKLEAPPRGRPHEWFTQVARDFILGGEIAKAADLLSAKGLVANAARARLDAAAELSDQGHYKEANEQLEKALAFYRSVGATRYIREAEVLLAASEPETPTAIEPERRT